jgi:hypothetical protein
MSINSRTFSTMRVSTANFESLNLCRRTIADGLPELVSAKLNTSTFNTSSQQLRSIAFCFQLIANDAPARVLVCRLRCSVRGKKAVRYGIRDKHMSWRVRNRLKPGQERANDRYVPAKELRTHKKGKRGGIRNARQYGSPGFETLLRKPTVWSQLIAGCVLARRERRIDPGKSPPELPAGLLSPRRSSGRWPAGRRRNGVRP